MKKTIILALSFFALFFVPIAVSRADEYSGDVNQRLSRILDNQKQIMDSLEQIKSELQIIKVRASSR